MKNPQPKWKGIRKQIKGTIMNISMQHISKDVFFYAKNNAPDYQPLTKKLKKVFG
jgi:hypothetical protein